MGVDVAAGLPSVYEPTGAAQPDLMGLGRILSGSVRKESQGKSFAGADSRVRWMDPAKIEDMTTAVTMISTTRGGKCRFSA